MSLFNQLQGEIIKNPKSTYSYLRVRKQKEETAEEKAKREKAERKELCKKKKEELGEEEFKLRRKKEWYQRNKKEQSAKNLEKYYRNKADEEAMIEEIYKNVYDVIPEPTDYNKLYAEKYKKDDTDSGGKYRYYWRASRLNDIRTGEMINYTQPIRINNRKNMNVLMSQLGNMQDKAYEYMKPHMDEITIKDFLLSRKQFFTKAPMWIMSEKMRELTSTTDISNNQLCTVASALLRGKYIQSELYMGRLSFLVGDVIITQNGNVFRPVLENNIPWLTKDTVEELHQNRIDWLKKKTDDLKIYALRDCYLLKIQPNEWETLFYIVPT